MLYNKAIGATASAQKVYIEEVFQTFLYAGNGSTQTITNGIDLTGKGGLVWTKSRSNASSHALFDTNRGISKSLSTNSTATEEDYGNPPSTAFAGILSFDSSGYTLGNDGFAQLVNVNGRTYTSWTFRKAAKFFDVVTYTGNETARTISHSLGSVPGCIIVKRTNGVSNWNVYHRSILATKYLILNDTTGSSTETFWNNTDPTSSVFSIGTNAAVNANGGTYVAYLFAHDAGGFGDSGNEGVIKCGSYLGSGGVNDLTINLGWEPQWLLIKRTDSSGDWQLIDNLRGFVSGGVDAELNPNLSNAESSGTFISPLATGFQLSTTDAGYNAYAGTYIYIAIRRGPMKTPTDATKVFNAATLLDTGSAVVNTGFAIDFGIDAIRTGNVNNSFVWDRLRGGPLYLRTSQTAAEVSSGGSSLVFDRSDSTQLKVGSGENSVLWSFRRAPGFFDVVAYTGTGVARTVSHNLGVVPELMIVKSRSAANWATYDSLNGSTKYLTLNDNSASTASSAVWNDSSPSATNFNVGTSSRVNTLSTTYIAYLFATCPGVSKVGSYTGTGTTQQINCGFTNGARFVLIKRTDSTGDWYVWDTARGIVSGNDPYLLLNSTAAEVTNTDYIDPLSSGFEISSTAPAAINANGGSFIFLAVA